MNTFKLPEGDFKKRIMCCTGTTGLGICRPIITAISKTNPPQEKSGRLRRVKKQTPNPSLRYVCQRCVDTGGDYHIPFLSQNLSTPNKTVVVSSPRSSLPINAAVFIFSSPEGLSSAQLALIDASKAAGVKQIFPSKSGFDSSNEEIEILPLLKGRNDISNHVRSIGR